MSHQRARSQGPGAGPGSGAPQRHRRRVRLPRGRWLWLAAFTAIVVVLATAVVLRSTGSSPSGACTGKPVTLTIATSSGQFPALDRLAQIGRAHV